MLLKCYPTGRREELQTAGRHGKGKSYGAESENGNRRSSMSAGSLNVDGQCDDQMSMENMTIAGDRLLADVTES